MLFQSNPRPSSCPLGYTAPKKQAYAPILHPLIAGSLFPHQPPPKPLALPPCPLSYTAPRGRGMLIRARG